MSRSLAARSIPLPRGAQGHVFTAAIFDDSVRGGAFDYRGRRDENGVAARVRSHLPRFGWGHAESQEVLGPATQLAGQVAAEAIVGP